MILFFMIHSSTSFFITLQPSWRMFLDFDLLIPWNILALRSLDRCFVPLSKVVVSYCSELIRRDVNGNCARRLIDLLLDRYFSPNGTPPEAVRDILCRYAEYSSTQFFTKLDLYMSGNLLPRHCVSSSQSCSQRVLIRRDRSHPLWPSLLAYLQELLVEVAQPLLSLLPAADSASAPSHRSSHSSSSFSSSASHHGNKRSSSQPILPLPATSQLLTQQQMLQTQQLELLSCGLLGLALLLPSDCLITSCCCTVCIASDSVFPPEAQPHQRIHTGDTTRSLPPPLLHLHRSLRSNHSRSTFLSFLHPRATMPSSSPY